MLCSSLHIGADVELYGHCRVKAFAVFMPIQGVTWVFAFLTFEGSATTQYIFVIGTVFQGIILFVYHCLLDPRVNRA